MMLILLLLLLLVLIVVHASCIDIAISGRRCVS
jgi:hypothetical protein